MLLHTRKRAVQWISHLQTYFDMSAATLHLAVRMLDRFTADPGVPPITSSKRHSLVSTTALCLAAKYVEVYTEALARSGLC